jgi:DNA repair exonuclease SbcCD ATPase subunit
MERQRIERDYQAVDAEIARLREKRERGLAAIDELQWMMNEVRRRGGGEMEELLEEVESFLRLALQTSDYRDRYRALHGRLAELGKRLGYW